MKDRPIFCDIDGTLTDAGDSKHHNANVNTDRIERLKNMIAMGYQVVIWSGNGTAYAKEFCQTYDIVPLAAMGKPTRMIDDNPSIRPGWAKLICSPEEFFT